MSCLNCTSNTCICENETCINPLIFLVKTTMPFIQEYIINNVTAVESLNLSVTNSEKLCCPSCQNGIYFLGDKTNFELLINQNQTFCCIEYLALNTENSINCCGTDFINSIQRWIELLIPNLTVDSPFQITDLNSLIEGSNFNGQSSLGVVLNYLQLTYPTLSINVYILLMDIILKYGIVIKCNGCKITFYTTQEYLNDL